MSHLRLRSTARGFLYRAVFIGMFVVYCAYAIALLALSCASVAFARVLLERAWQRLSAVDIIVAIMATLPLGVVGVWAGVSGLYLFFIACIQLWAAVLSPRQMEELTQSMVDVDPSAPAGSSGTEETPEAP